MANKNQGSIASNNPSPRCQECHGKGTLAHYVCRATGCREWYTRDVYEYHAAYKTPLPVCGHPAPKLDEGVQANCPICRGTGRVALTMDAAGFTPGGSRSLV